MTFGNLANLVAYFVDDLNFGYFTRTQVNRFLNNAQFETAKKLINAGDNYYLKCAQTNTVIGQCGYALPLDFLKVNRLELVISGAPPNEAVGRLQFITLNEQDQLFTHSGEPAAYVLKKSSIQLFPTPDSILALRLSYTHRVAEMSLDAEVPDVPESYHELIALYATRDCLLKDGREASLIQAKIAEYEKTMDEDADERNVDQPRMIVQTGDWGGNDWGM